jgi:hypothetical protein
MVEMLYILGYPVYHDEVPALWYLRSKIQAHNSSFFNGC